MKRPELLLLATWLAACTSKAPTAPAESPEKPPASRATPPQELERSRQYSASTTAVAEYRGGSKEGVPYGFGFEPPNRLIAIYGQFEGWGEEEQGYTNAPYCDALNGKFADTLHAVAGSTAACRTDDDCTAVSQTALDCRVAGKGEARFAVCPLATASNGMQHFMSWMGKLAESVCPSKCRYSISCPTNMVAKCVERKDWELIPGPVTYDPETGALPSRRCEMVPVTERKGPKKTRL